jgi:cell division protein FtsQ
MRSSLRNRILTRRNRLQRSRGSFLREALSALLLLSAVAVMSACLIGIFHGVVQAPYFGLRETVVRGCKEITEQEVLAMAALQPSVSILAVNREKVARRVKQNPWVREVSVGLELPDRMIIDVRERLVRAIVKRNDGLYLMDTGGGLFKRVERGDDVDFPVITGYESPGMEDTAFRKAVTFLNKLSEAKTHPNLQDIAGIHLDPVAGLSIVTTSGLCLKLGSDQYDEKLARLATVMADLERRTGRPRYAGVDLDDPSKVTVQKKDIFGPAGSADPGKEYRL